MRWQRWLGWAIALFVAYLGIGVLALGIGGPWLVTRGAVAWHQPCADPKCPPEEIGFVGDPKAAYGMDFEAVRYATENGDAAAWLVPGQAHAATWAIFVHGIGGIRENGYRQMAILHDSGMPVLLITYRNDEGAPAAADNRHSFGLTEWRDVAAAVDWARASGARRIVLVGESMGGAIIGQYLARVGDTQAIAGLALDAPALDFGDVVRQKTERFYGPLAPVVEAMGVALMRATGVQLADASSLKAVADFKGPILLVHGSGDPLVPVTISDRLAALRPDAIYLRTDSDHHLWSYKDDPVAYRAAMEKWLTAVNAGP